ncbi:MULTISPECIES: sensor histidine kinase [Brevibacillus]|jgi:signal transduction histidine kinase|uniref:sensor histidine kinase n=1 Tax=Brevibacillus TaxID=55080 RepID=UPI00203F8D73|nr:ATP-binding protein [Brevibacillus borstelensis]MCM3590568.1 ATP-binding protein [Brevibacillus borstelensis]MED2008515.1 ATP-binding protein [Brevibacillus borstelensis]
MKRIWMKLALAFMAVGASGILISALLSIKEMDIHFSMYVNEARQLERQDVLEVARRAYEAENRWGERAFSQMDAIAKVLGLRIVLQDQNQSRIGQFGDESAVRGSGYTKLPVAVDGQTVGYLTISHHEKAPSHSVETHFQRAHTNALLWTMLILIVVVIVVSICIAKNMVKPIVRISDASIAVSRGDRSVRVPGTSGKDELAGLVDRFNHLIESLEHQEQLRKRLTSDISHELRTPLNTLLAQTEGMIDGVWEASPEHLEATRAEVLRLIRLVSDLDEVIQAESGTLKINQDMVDISKIAELTADAMSAALAQKNIVLKKQLEGEAMVLGDRHRLAQVFTNLLSNAWKHTAPHGEIRLTVKKERDRIVAVVSDNGSGIAAEDLPHIFDRFYRGDRSRNRERGGAGLGLTIAKGLVEAHDGQISIRSAEGIGTSVTMLFPAAGQRNSVD